MYEGVSWYYQSLEGIPGVLSRNVAVTYVPLCQGTSKDMSLGQLGSYARTIVSAVEHGHALHSADCHSEVSDVSDVSGVPDVSDASAFPRPSDAPDRVCITSRQLGLVSDLM